ncbi:acyl-CoA dehydrogenase family protein [Streptomyces sp. A3M-1-3]|uniref:acyl-CoA dehydrogenase family protein n=1 Tax=Streptomyces sp. A3M-1-3 TaxID=2962044 RepID=UPI0020B88526|nr:acyl-CoA dehydrogenase [Streptomyces sp. A3M-1-3]MCP3821913.1 acyl-CoA dehydrogenase family protein [Streptomyces sp. A3M-1-3]
MHFQLTDDQRDLRRGIRELLAARFGREALRAAVDSPPAGLRYMWTVLAEAGFFSLRLAESDGGVGLGMAEAVLVHEEAGRVLLPGPLVVSQLAAGLVKGAAEGTAVVTAVDLARGPGQAGPLVAHADAADSVLVLYGDTVRVLPAASLDAEPLRSVDPLTPLHLVRRTPLPAGGPVAAGAGAARLRREAALLTAAQQVGSASGTLDMAVRYAREREQFGQPIGGFQAVKHLCAQMLVRAEPARTAVYAAAVTGTATDIAVAKLLADEAAVRNARDCLQVYGGMGFTWEADVHLHLKRAWVRAREWQTAQEAEELLAEAI